MLYEGIYQACCLKKVEIKDNADRNEKYRHRTGGGYMGQCYVQVREVWGKQLYFAMFYTSPKKETTFL